MLIFKSFTSLSLTDIIHTGISVSDAEYFILKKFPDSVKSLGSIIYHMGHHPFSKIILSHGSKSD